MFYHGISWIGGFARLLLWTVALVALIALISVPTSLAVQALLGAGAILAVFVLKYVVQSRFGRLLLLSVASIVVMRYWFWRLFDTLPAPDDTASFVVAVILFAVETYLIGVFFLSCLVVADPIDHRRPKPIKVRDLPTVDVLIPSLNESAELLALTLAAAKNMSYPAPLLNVVLCDDGGTDERCMNPDPAVSIAARARREKLTALCADLGVVYRTRAQNRGAKAGNLTDALATLDGDLVAIFDADHMPSRDFLARTVGYFSEDPGLALVQTPHFFLNGDPIARNLKLSDDTPPENEMFYSLMHRGLDRWGGAFFCGSAALLRRTAIDSVGGISGRTITEDAETSMMIHAKGWRSMYVNHAMVAGLQPETFASFLTQRGRWATGMTQLLLTRNPFLVRGLSFWQRLCYLNSMMYWMFPLVRLTLLMAPLIYLFFGLEIVVTTAPEALAYAGSYLVIAYMVQNILFSSVRWPFLSEIYEVAQAPYLARAVTGAMLNPRGAKFKVTSKDETITDTQITHVYRPLMFLFLLMLAGVAALIWRWNAYPGDRNVLQIVGAWVLFNTVLVGASLRALVEQRQRRTAPRVERVDCPSVAEFLAEDGAPVETPCVVVNASYSGLGLTIPPGALPQTMRRPQVGDSFRLIPAQVTGIEDAEPIICKIASIGAADGRMAIGAELEPEQTGGAYATFAAVMNGDSRRWQVIRQRQTSKRRGLLKGLAQTLSLGFNGVYHTALALVAPNKPQVGEALNVADGGWNASIPIEAQAFIAVRSGQAFTPAKPVRPATTFPAERRRASAAVDTHDVHLDDKLKSA